ncbi:hypothetical protein BAN20980_06676 [Burkholderia anthina]|uniref:Uncharacterized protein n=1 Tax=Burkholderia anthina TaxID=179879 RepID=A0A6P2GK30_9BURK|nr:hypothetical protein BAN20980_06676 [Burkholderia anthina]
MADRRHARAGLVQRRNPNRARRTDDDVAVSRASRRDAGCATRGNGRRRIRAVVTIRLPACADVDRNGRCRSRDSRPRTRIRTRILRRRTGRYAGPRSGRAAFAASRCIARCGAARDYPDGQRTRRVGRTGRSRRAGAGEYACQRPRLRIRRRRHARRAARQREAASRCRARKRPALVRVGRRSRRRSRDGRRRGAARGGGAGRGRTGAAVDGRSARVADRGGDLARDGRAVVRASCA